jgi:hypothetical protein
MSDQSLVTIEPFAVRPKEAARLESCGITELYKRLAAGEYESYCDGTMRMITVRSIRARQQRALASSNASGDKPARRPGPGRPKKKKKSAISS